MAGHVAAHGVVLTRPHIVDLLLDLAGYTADRDLRNLRLLEPASGHGAFLVRAVERLMQSIRERGQEVTSLTEAVLAFDVDEKHVEISCQAVCQVLRRYGVDARTASKLADKWIRQDDFLLAPLTDAFDVVVGNPPYIRIEQIRPDMQQLYRGKFTTLHARADLYVAFLEHSLTSLAADGVLAMICADRWTLNRYGAALRRRITSEYSTYYYVDLHQASPFESEVIAYPSIFAIGRTKKDETYVARMTSASPEECAGLRDSIKKNGRSPNGFAVFSSWFRGDEPWIVSSSEHLEALRDLERRFKPLEAFGGTRVGIGVATGNDKVYIVPSTLDVEKDRLVPLVMRSDIREGRIDDAQRCVIHAFADEGGVVDLELYPKLAQYLKEHEDSIKRRHVARKNPASWFRTIDRVYPELVSTPKLLIPDIAGANEVTYDAGRFHPHHNLYFVTSKEWDLEVLGGLLSSRVALFFVWSYAVKMRGGYLRFQAQYLRRIRVPDPNRLSRKICRSIRSAYRRRDFPRLDDLALEAYEIESLPAFDFVDTRT